MHTFTYERVLCNKETDHDNGNDDVHTDTADDKGNKKDNHTNGKIGKNDKNDNTP